MNENPYAGIMRVVEHQGSEGANRLLALENSQGSPVFRLLGVYKRVLGDDVGEALVYSLGQQWPVSCPRHGENAGWAGGPLVTFSSPNYTAKAECPQCGVIPIKEMKRK